MTTGSTVVDRRTNVPYYVNGAYGGSILSGVYRTKTWSGADGLPPINADRGILRVYTTINRRTGRTVRRTFRQKPPKRAHDRTPHDYTMSSFAMLSDPFDYVNNYTVGGSPQTQSVAGYSYSAASPLLPALPDWTSNDDIDLINGLKERSRGSSFNASIFLSQGNQALEMIGDSAIRIARGLKLFKRGNVIGAIHEMSKSADQTARLRKRLPKGMWTTNLRQQGTKQLSSNWLELQYGWLPLLSDMRDGATLAAHQLNVPFRQRVVVRKSLRNKDPVPPTSAFGAAEAYGIVSKQIVAYFSEPESIPKMLGLTDPLSIAWENTPFSFVADWILPVGDWLEARAYTTGLTGTFISTTYTRQLWRGIAGKAYRNDALSLVGSTSVFGGSYFASKATMSRSVTASLQVPRPRVVPLSEALSFKRCLNGIALLVGATKNVFR